MAEEDKQKRVFPPMRLETGYGNKFQIKQLFIGTAHHLISSANQPPDEFQDKARIDFRSSHDFYWSPIFFLLPLIRPEIN